jgi:adenosylcobinamide-GDP ribazoletransferase
MSRPESSEPPIGNMSEPPAAREPDPNSPALLWADFTSAARSLTILGRRPESVVDRVGRPGLFYPLIGLGVGALLAVIDFAVRDVVTQELTSIFLVSALVIVSVGRHLDGFANTADGLIGYRGREWALAIMRDRRLGTFGTAALVFLISLKMRGFDLLSEQVRLYGLLLPPMLGRWSMVVLAHGSREAVAAGEARQFDPGVGFREFAGASVIAFLIAFVIGEELGLLAVIVVAATTVALRLYFHRRLGGVNEHGLGAVAEATEAIALLIFVLAS